MHGADMHTHVPSTELHPRCQPTNCKAYTQLEQEQQQQQQEEQHEQQQHDSIAHIAAARKFLNSAGHAPGASLFGPGEKIVYPMQPIQYFPDGYINYGLALRGRYVVRTEQIEETDTFKARLKKTVVDCCFDLPAHTYIGQFTGTSLTAEEARRRITQAQCRGETLPWLMQVWDEEGTELLASVDASDTPRAPVHNIPLTTRDSKANCAYKYYRGEIWLVTTHFVSAYKHLYYM